ncbi:MAG: flagellar motor stator protein MotA [Alphaproteobacteria bacterium]|nr:MAG: flagellar motor stator protein MotA [Alphaproteobacteria bacterium]
MLLIIGFVIVIGAVVGGYAIPGGHLAVLFQPFEVMIIVGAAIGAFITANTKTILSGSGKAIGRILKGPKHNKDSYVELLSLLYQTFKLARSKGNLALEKHVENPEESDLFTQYPKVAADHHALTFLCDYLRLLTMGSDNPHELEALMDQDLEAHHHEEMAIADALRNMADGMPALGIVAAVLGVIHTMGSITEPPEILGHLIGAALVGTFMGILISYGFVGPMAQALNNIIDADGRYYHCIKAGILAHVSGHPPAISVEYARKVLSSDVRPTFYELEEAFENLAPIAA